MSPSSVAPLLVVLAVGCAGSGGSAGGAGSRADAGSRDAAAADSSHVVALECGQIDLPPRARAAWRPPARAPLAPVVPAADFATATPAEAGFDGVRLEQALSFSLPASRTEGVVVVRNGYLVAERYFGSFTASTRHESYSVAKSFTSLLVGIAIDRGLLAGTDERICSHYPEWDCSASTDPRSRITVAHAMNLATGLEWSEDWRTGATTPNDVFLAGSDVLGYVLSRRGVEEPGTRQRYSTGDPALLTAIIQDATGKTALAFAREALLGPIGASGIQWASDAKGRTTTYAGIQATAREYARVGLLVARGGKWGDTEVVSKRWIERTTRAVEPCRETYRYLWHVNAPMRLGDPDPSCPDLVGCMPKKAADIPGEAFFALGVGGQMILVVPSADLVAVRLAQDGFTAAENWDGYARGLLEGLLAALE
jgi:CubicO group peptidase (beta-lactamase class C family)